MKGVIATPLPNDFADVFVGRILRVDLVAPKRRVVQIQTNYPSAKSGSVLRLPFYGTIRRGDRVAVVGHISNDWIEPILIRNISTKIDTPAIPSRVLIGARGFFKRQRMTIPNPLISKAGATVDAALQKYEGEMTVAAPPTQTELNPAEFEMLVADLFERLGYENVTISGGAGDKGVDIRASRTESDGKIEKIIAQCKHQSLLHRVSPTQVRDFAHSVAREREDGVNRGYFITSSYFSPECFDKENCGDQMELIDRDQLEVLLKKVGLTIPQPR
jgi:hypothetical protein